MIQHVLPTKQVAIYMAMGLVVSLFAWTVGYVTFLRFAHAAALTNVSDTLTDSDLGVVATHTIAYTNGTTTNAGELIRITFDPTTDRFDGFGSLVTGDVTATGMTIAASCTGAASEVLVSASTTAGNESLVLTVCPTDTISAGSKSISIHNRLTNPTSSGSYVVRISAGAGADITDTRVAIIDDVVVTAAVDTSFTFTITGVATGTSLFGGTVTTTRASTPTALGFGTLPLNAPVTLAQQLNVATNARNGFVVTVKEDQNLLSSTGADIDLFANGQATAVPTAWVAPSSTLDVEETYGHFGLSSNDSDLNSAEFGTSSAKFAGNFQATSSRQVFSHTGPSDGTTQDKGLATVLYRIQIGALQEAGNDYTNILTYVATPTF